MAEINSAGYDELRKAIDPNETHQDFNVHELLDDNNSQIVRASTSDSTVEVSSATAANPFTLKSTIDGSDSRISLPQTFAGSRVFRADTNGENVTAIESHTNVTLESTDDQIVVEHDVEVPQI